MASAKGEECGCEQIGQIGYLYDVALEIYEGAVKREETNHFVAVVIVVADIAEGA